MENNFGIWLVQFGKVMISPSESMLGNGGMGGGKKILKKIMWKDGGKTTYTHLVLSSSREG